MRTNITKTSIWSLASILLATLLTFTACGKDGDSGDGDTSSSSVEAVHNSSSSGGGSLSSSSGTQSSSGGGTEGSVAYGGKSYKTVKIGEQWWMAENLAIDIPGSVCYPPSTDCPEGADCAPPNFEHYCGIYGRLYDWETAMGFSMATNCVGSQATNCILDPSQHRNRGICPSGWHLPSKAEWGELFGYVESNTGGRYSAGAYFTAGEHLRAKTHWDSTSVCPPNTECLVPDPVRGLDTYGFAALPGGIYVAQGFFSSTRRDVEGFFQLSADGYWWTSDYHYQENVAGIIRSAYASRMSYNSASASLPEEFADSKMSVRCVGD